MVGTYCTGDSHGPSCTGCNCLNQTTVAPVRSLPAQPTSTGEALAIRAAAAAAATAAAATVVATRLSREHCNISGCHFKVVKQQEVVATWNAAAVAAAAAAAVPAPIRVHIAGVMYAVIFFQQEDCDNTLCLLKAAVL